MSFIQAYESGVIGTIVQAYVDGGVATPTLADVMSSSDGNIASTNLNMDGVHNILNVNGLYKNDTFIQTYSEEDIFDILGMKFLLPIERI
jgi:hypothetical protein